MLGGQVVAEVEVLEAKEVADFLQQEGVLEFRPGMLHLLLGLRSLRRWWHL